MAGEHVAKVQGTGSGTASIRNTHVHKISPDGDIEVFRMARCVEAAVWLGLRPRSIFGLVQNPAHQSTSYTEVPWLSRYRVLWQTAKGTYCSIVADACRQPSPPSSSALPRLDQGTCASQAHEVTHCLSVRSCAWQFTLRPPRTHRAASAWLGPIIAITWCTTPGRARRASHGATRSPEWSNTMATLKDGRNRCHHLVASRRASHGGAHQITGRPQRSCPSA